MPNFDGTGPFGDGRPGRGLGNCYPERRAQSRPFGRGLRRALGGSFGRRAGWQNPQAMNSDDMYSYDTETLKKEKSRLEKLLCWVSDRLAEIER